MRLFSSQHCCIVPVVLHLGELLIAADLIVVVALFGGCAAMDHHRCEELAGGIGGRIIFPPSYFTRKHGDGQYGEASGEWNLVNMLQTLPFNNLLGEKMVAVIVTYYRLSGPPAN